MVWWWVTIPVPQKEARTTDDAANGSACLQERPDKLQFLADGETWQAKQHDIGGWNHLCGLTCDDADLALSGVAFRHTNGQLLLPALWMARKQTDLTITMNGEKSRHDMA